MSPPRSPWVSRPALLPGALLALLALLPPVPAGAVDPLDTAARSAISASEARSVGTALAGPKYLGRGTGQKGNEDAARWLAKELREVGFEPGVSPDRVEDGKTVEGEFLQWFDVPATRLEPGATGVRTPNVIGILRGTGLDPAAVATPADPAGPAAPPAGPAGPAGPAPPTAEGAPPEPASAPRPRNPEVVLLGAHFDHLGVRGGNADPKKPPKKSSVFWGADDNASGTTAVLLVARALGRMAADGLRPRRTIVVAFFTGEEMGLLGSRHYVGSPVFPLADTTAMINLDMVGRNGTKAFEVYGNGSSPELDAWHREVLAETKLDCSYPPPALLQRSDQWSFYEAGIPVLFLHGGLHGDYHTPRDTADGLNYPKIALAARHALGILWKAANAPGRPGFRKIDMTGAGGRLGIAVDPATPEEIDSLSLEEGRGAVRVTAVFAGSMGEKFFEAGDLIFSWNGFPIMADDPVGRFTGFLNMARAGDPVTIRYLRGKDRKAATVKF
jgi:hypothetical protein